jgi:hypothetical protein
MLKRAKSYDSALGASGGVGERVEMLGDHLKYSKAATTRSGMPNFNRRRSRDIVHKYKRRVNRGTVEFEIWSVNIYFASTTSLFYSVSSIYK